jgi:hypothetical protein
LETGYSEAFVYGSYIGGGDGFDIGVVGPSSGNEAGYG